jgi:hypothetical protein
MDCACFSPKRAGRRGYRGFSGILLLILALPVRLFSEEPPPAEKPRFTVPGPGAELLWTGSWEQDAYLINRLDLRLRGFGFTLRGQGIDKRPAWENREEENAAFAGGLYHDPTGSRILYGIQDEGGLPARIRSPWIRAIPFVEYHKPSVSDLLTVPSSTKEADLHIYLSSPWIRFFRGFASVSLDGDWIPAYGGGISGRFGKTELRLEGFFTERSLAPRRPSAWFSETPPLPERDFRIYGANCTFISPFFTLATDWAYSQTFAYGTGLYGNLGLSLGNKPWRFSLAADGAGGRYVGRDGGAVNRGFRSAARFEWRGSRNSLFRLGTSLRSGGLGASFNRSSSTLYFRPSVSRNGGGFFRLSRLSLTAERAAADTEKPEDKLEGTLAFDLGPVKSTLQGNVAGTTGGNGNPFPYPGGGYTFQSFKITEELSYAYKMLRLRARAGYAGEAKKDPRWSASVSAGIQGKAGRLTVKAFSEDLPREWACTLSWRLGLKSK